MKRLLAYIIPQKIAEFRTPFNTYIRINDEGGGKRKLLVNGSPQSGRYIDVLWNAALGSFGIKELTGVKKILVLGTAGGTVIQKLYDLFPYASITGVEIDETMIEIGKKYFSLDSIDKLHVVHADANAFVRQEVKKKTSYDLVIVDLFFGRVVPKFLTTPKFVEEVHTLVGLKGHVVINYLRELEYETLADVFKDTLQKRFSSVRDHVIHRNRFFFCSIV
ncbi:MAG: fused MFS/spermidine synthase [Microgenomates group bacterium]